MVHVAMDTDMEEIEIVGRAAVPSLFWSGILIVALLLLALGVRRLLARSSGTRTDVV